MKKNPYLKTCTVVINPTYRDRNNQVHSEIGNIHAKCFLGITANTISL